MAKVVKQVGRQRKNKAQHDAATKAAVMAALLSGQAVNAVAKEYNISASTIRNWKAATKLENAIDQEQRYEIGDLLLVYLRGILNALTLQARHFGKATWLNSQSADSLAVLHGVAADKAIRIIEALAGEPDGNDRSGSDNGT